MKREKLIIFICVLIFLISFVNAVDSCNVVAKSSCTGNSKIPILYLYSDTNSHAIWHSASASEKNSANYVLCCNFVENKVCTSNNEIFSLSGQSNAHAEIPSLNNANYNTKVCYGDLECIGTNNPSSSYPIHMISLSSETNAHVGKYADYQTKIVCRHKSSSNIFQNSKIVFPNNLNNNLNLNQNQLGSSVAKVDIKLSNINTNTGTTIYLEIYERDLTAGGGSGGGFFNQIIQSLIQLTGKITGHAIFSTNTGSTTLNYIYTPIRTGNNKLSGILNQNGEVTFEWTITPADVNKAGKENNYDFIFKSINGNNNKRYDNNPLKVKINWDASPSGSAQKGKFWLSKDRATKIKNKIMKWDELPSSSWGGASGESTGMPAGSTGRVISTLTGNAIASDDNLVYMNASGLLINSAVSFEVWEKDTLEGGSDDNVRTISARVDNNQTAFASFYVNQADVEKMKSEDPIIYADSTAEYELYFKVKNSTGYISIPDNEYSLLKLNVIYPGNYNIVCGNGICETGENSINCPQDCPAVQTQYLTNAKGIWTNSEFNAGLTHYVYQENDLNIVGMHVLGITPLSEDQEVYFEIWEKDDDNTIDSDDPIIVGNSLMSPVIDGIANTTWAITSQNLLDAENETDYEFYFKIRYLSEIKSFKDVVLNVTMNSSTGNNTNNTGGGGGGNYCDDIYYCSDYATSYKCNLDPCSDVLINEFTLNPGAECDNPNVNCYCIWNNDECGFSYNLMSNTDLGACNYIQLGTQDDCENSGVLINSYGANWSWSLGNCYNTSTNCTDAILNPIEESCMQKDGCWRRIDYTYENCTDYEESVECSPVEPDSEIDDKIGSIIKNKNNWWIFLIIGILIVGVVIFFVIRRLKKRDTETRLFKTKENFNNILSYIKNARAQRMPELEIRKSLLRAGWTEQQIAYAVKKSAN